MKQMEYFFLEINIHLVKISLGKEVEFHVGHRLHREQPLGLIAFIRCCEVNIAEERALIVRCKDKVRFRSLFNIRRFSLLNKVNSIY